jgi:2-polyprenyl-3-methyl-5-hydroxy-6-metoxy-1,4-benzoquinol methylase
MTTVTVVPDHMTTRESYQEYCDLHASNPAHHRIFHRPYWHQFPEIQEGSSILDMGAYTGGNLIYYGLRGHEITGVEIAQPYADTFEKIRSCFSDEANARMRMTVGRIEDYESYEHFDVVLCGEVLEHAQEPAVIFERAAEHLHRGGRFFVATHRNRGEGTWVRDVPFHHLMEWAGAAGLDSCFTSEYDALRLFAARKL